MKNVRMENCEYLSLQKIQLFDNNNIALEISNRLSMSTYQL